jgi:hypothetical protein
LNDFYKQETIRRFEALQKINESPENIKTALNFLSVREHIVDWMVDWCWTSDPRNPAIGLPADVPWIPWKRQIEFIEWFYNKYLNQESGIVEKSRDAGATWLFCLVFLREWRWEQGFAGGIGSRKLTLVDDKENPKAIFVKLRHLLYKQPRWWLPIGFNDKHDKIANLINPENGANIAGEGGDDIGRGDRRSVYLIDEAAFLEHPQMVDSALSQTTNSQFDLSTPCGMNYFGQKRHSGKVDVFTFHWKQDERKTEEWYEEQKKTLDDVIVAQEIDIDYHASVEGLFIPPEHVKAAVELELPSEGIRSAGLDVAAGGANRSSLAIRKGCHVSVETWNYKNGNDLVHRVIEEGNENRIEYLNYDKIGVGHSVYSTIERTERKIKFEKFGVNAGAKPSGIFYPEFNKKGRDIFINARAEWWYITARMFKKTHEYVNGKVDHPLEELISIENDGELIAQLSSPKKLITETGKIKVESKDKMLGRGVKSPDKADALIMAVIPQNAGSKFVWSFFTEKDTHKLEIHWEETKYRKTLHYGSIVQLKDLSVWFLEALWDDVTGYLYIYGCWSEGLANPSLQVPKIILRMQAKKYRIENILANSDMFSEDIRKAPATYYRREFSKRLPETSVGFREAIKYDQMGSIVEGNKMFYRKRILVEKSCKEPARQFAGWTVENGKPSNDDCGYCIALCQILSELKRRHLIKKEIPTRDYGY